jgi:hypothetical protein
MPAMNIDEKRSSELKSENQSAICCASGRDGTASLANREIAVVLHTNYSKDTFSGAVRCANDAAHAGYFEELGAGSPEITHP